MNAPTFGIGDISKGSTESMGGQVGSTLLDCLQ